jgi:hypothetical protein
VRIFSTIMVFVLCFTLVTVPVGCTKPTQAQINTAVTDIANWTPVVASEATALLTTISGFDPVDATQVQSFITIMNQDSTDLAILCKQYLAAPSQSLMTQISALVSTLATTDSSALFAVLQIKNPQSQATARAALTTIATAVTILAGYLQSVNVQVSATAANAIDTLKLYANHDQMQNALDTAMAQGLVPQGTKLEQLGF